MKYGSIKKYFCFKMIFNIQNTDSENLLPSPKSFFSQIPSFKDNILYDIFLFDQAVVIGIEKKEDKWHEKWGLASLYDNLVPSSSFSAALLHTASL